MPTTLKKLQGRTNAFYVNPDRVVSVQEATEYKDATCFITLMDGEVHVVRGTALEITDKLGIITE